MSDIVFDRMLFDHLDRQAARSDESAYLRTQVQLLAAEVERLRLTARERAAIREALAANELEAKLFGDKAAKVDAKALRELLERHGDKTTHWMPLPAPPTDDK